MPVADTWQQAHRVLCVRLDSTGDLLMTAPAIRALRHSHPDRTVTLLTSPAGAEAARLIPEVDETIVYDAPWMKATAPRIDPATDIDMLDRIRRERFDAAVIFTVFSQNPLPAAMFCYLAGIPLRLAHCRENPYQLLTDWVAEREPERVIRHEVRRQLDLVATVGCETEDERIRITVGEEETRRVERLLADLRVNLERPWAVVHAGATAASRRWPPEMFAQVARRLTADYGWQIVFTGDESERALVAGIRSAMGGVPSSTLAGKLKLGEMAALLALAPLLISNNTGPVHMAAGTGTPVVDIYALTNPQHTPWMVPARVLSHDVPCKNCFKSVCPEVHNDCIRKVTPDQVVAAALDLYRSTREAKLMLEMMR